MPDATTTPSSPGTTSTTLPGGMTAVDPLTYLAGVTDKIGSLATPMYFPTALPTSFVNGAITFLAIAKPDLTKIEWKTQSTAPPSVNVIGLTRQLGGTPTGTVVKGAMRTYFVQETACPGPNDAETPEFWIALEWSDGPYVYSVNIQPLPVDCGGTTTAEALAFADSVVICSAPSGRLSCATG